MITILNLILSNLQMVLSFMIPFAFVRLSDICFGMILSFKDSTLRFDWKKLLCGIAWGLMVIIGLTTLVSGIVTLPALLELYSITIVDTEALSSMINILSIIGILTTSIITYGKDSYTKLVKIFKISELNEVKKSTRLNEGGDEDVRYS